MKMEDSNFFFNIDEIKIPLVTTGTSPFIGAGQFGINGPIWRKKFLNNTEAMVDILEASYKAGARGIEAIPVGKIIDSARIMSERYSDYVITGSTLPYEHSGIHTLINADAKMIFVHGMISDAKGRELIKLLDIISDHGVIPGIATHDPIPTIQHVIENDLNVRAFLIPFNAEGYLMGNQFKLEELVNSTKNYSFIGMKVLAAGKIRPDRALKYISQHNIDAVSIGITNVQEAMITNKIASEILIKKDKKTFKNHG